jgi:hypothetical protein
VRIATDWCGTSFNFASRIVQAMPTAERRCGASRARRFRPSARSFVGESHPSLFTRMPYG